MGYWNTEATKPHMLFIDGSPIKYWSPERIVYHCGRYDKQVVVELGRPSDGATRTSDLDRRAWLLHDKVCYTGKWEDGTRLTNWKASMLIYDVLMDEGYWFFARRWFLATLIGGGGEARKNGIFKVKRSK